MLKAPEALVQAIAAARPRAVHVAPCVASNAALAGLVRRLGTEGVTAPLEALSAPVALTLALGGGLISNHPTVALLGSAGLCSAAEVLASAGPFGEYHSAVVLIEGVSAQEPGLCPDNRAALAQLGRVPTLEPGGADEIEQMTRLAFRLSATAGMPVALRLSERALEDRGGSESRAEEPARGKALPCFESDDGPYVTSPLLSRFHGERRARRLQALEPLAGALCARTPLEGGGGSARRGVILAGHLGLRVQQRALSRGLCTLRLGMPFPLPEAPLQRFLGGLREVLVLEEGEPYLLGQIQGLAQRAGLTVRVSAPELSRERCPLAYDDAELEAALAAFASGAAGTGAAAPTSYDFAGARAFVDDKLALRLDERGEAQEEPWALHVARASREHAGLPANDPRGPLLTRLRALGRPTIITAGAGAAGSLGLPRRLLDVRLVPAGAAALAGALAGAAEISGAGLPRGAPLSVAVLDEGLDQSGELLGLLDNAQQRRFVLHLVLRRRRAEGGGAALLEAQLRAAGMEVLCADATDAARALDYLSQRPGPRALLCSLSG